MTPTAKIWEYIDNTKMRSVCGRFEIIQRSPVCHSAFEIQSNRYIGSSKSFHTAKNLVYKYKLKKGLTNVMD